MKLITPLLLKKSQCYFDDVPIRLYSAEYNIDPSVALEVGRSLAFSVEKAIVHNIGWNVWIAMRRHG